MKYKVNDILVSSFGYNCTLVEFYKVVKATDKTLWLKELKWKFTEDDGYGQAGKVIPEDVEIGSIIMKRQPSEGMESVKISSCERAYMWNGQPVYYNSYD